MHYLKQNFIQAFKIPANGMAPTLIKKDRILVNKYLYHNDTPKRGDIIVFRDPENPQVIVKRIVGLPKETIEIKDGQIFIDGLPIQINNTHFTNEGCLQKNDVFAIPSNSYFVLGDNSANSRDSRFFGAVPRSLVLGKVYKIYYPFKRSHIFE